MASYREYYRRNLPHWQPADATLFITFRLAGTLPQAVLDSLHTEGEREMKALSDTTDLCERSKQEYIIQRRTFARWDDALNAMAGGGPRWLALNDIAEIVAEALHYRDEREYDLLAYCIMPNHVHLVCSPLAVTRTGSPSHADLADSPISLAKIMQSLKRHTARLANQFLDRQGQFWQAENYDHVVCDSDELNRIILYVVNNPVKAGLVPSWEKWQWTYCRNGIIN